MWMEVGRKHFETPFRIFENPLLLAIYKTLAQSRDLEKIGRHSQSIGSLRQLDRRRCGRRGRELVLATYPCRIRNIFGRALDPLS